MLWARDSRHRKWIALAAGGALLAGLAVFALTNRKDSATPADTQPTRFVMTEREVAAGDLKGLLTSPGEDAPVMLLVPGSGPTDRDGNNPMGVKGNTYKLLAEALSKSGVAVARIDKRGMFSSAGAGDPNAASLEIYAADYRAWIDSLKAETGASCIWLMGHSEGALMVSAAAEGRSDVCGLVLISGMGRPLGQVLRAQLQANPANAPLLDQAFAALDKLEAGERVDVTGMHPALMPLFAPQVQGFLISGLTRDPPQIAARAAVPTLVLQGATDIQTSPEDAKLLAGATNGKLVILEGVNHLLKEAPAARAANIATYSNPALPLAPGVAEAIAAFVLENR